MDFYTHTTVCADPYSCSVLLQLLKIHQWGLQSRCLLAQRGIFFSLCNTLNNSATWAPETKPVWNQALLLWDSGTEEGVAARTRTKIAEKMTEDCEFRGACGLMCLDSELSPWVQSSMGPFSGQYLLGLSLADISFSSPNNDSCKGEQDFIPSVSILGQVCCQSHSLWAQFSQETSWSCLSPLSKRLQGQRSESWIEWIDCPWHLCQDKFLSREGHNPFFLELHKTSFSMAVFDN